MKVSVIMYGPPEDSSVTLAVMKGSSLEKAKKVALEAIADFDIQSRLVAIEYSKEMLAVEERHWEDDEWSEWSDSGGVVYLNTYDLVE